MGPRSLAGSFVRWVLDVPINAWQTLKLRHIATVVIQISIPKLFISSFHVGSSRKQLASLPEIAKIASYGLAYPEAEQRAEHRICDVVSYSAVVFMPHVYRHDKIVSVDERLDEVF